MTSTWRLAVNGVPDGVETWPGRGSIALAQGYAGGREFSVTRPDGSTVPTQARTLVEWPNGAPRWVQLDFAVNANGAHTVQDSASLEPVAMPVRSEADGTTYRLEVGRLRLCLDPAAGTPVARIVWDGRELAGPDQPWEFVVADAAGKSYPLVNRPARNVKIEADGPLRWQMSWETAHADESGEELLAVRFRVELLAGVEAFSLSYQFFHKLPGCDRLSLETIVCRFPFPALAGGNAVLQQEHHGLVGMPRAVRTRGNVAIRLDRTSGRPYVADAASLGDDFDYPSFLDGMPERVADTIGFEDDDACVLCRMADFINQRPKQIDVAPGLAAFSIWPAWAGTLDLPQGRSAAQRFDFRFTANHDGEADRLLASPATCFPTPATGWLEAEDAAAAGATWDAERLVGDEPGAGLFSHVMRSATTRLGTVAEMFNYGDSPQPGYTRTYAAGGRWRPPDEPPRELPLAAGGRSVCLGLVPLETLEPVWCNNEYDAIYCLALEALRTRDLGVMTKLRAAARHQIEVDFVHYSDHWQQHRGTPCHTYDHTAQASAYPSHHWTQGLYYYYCLTGDDDVPEIVRAICDYNIMWLVRPELKFMRRFNRELGWGALALVFGYELTGDEKYRREARTIIEVVAADAFPEPGQEPAPSVVSYPHAVGASFVANTVPMAVKAYYQATGEDWAREQFLEYVQVGLPRYNDKGTGPKIHDLFSESLAYAWELSGKREYLEETLWHLVMFMHGYSAINWTPDGGELDAKAYGRVYRGLALYLGAAARAGLLPEAERALLGTPEEPPG